MRVYLDNAATTPITDTVKSAIVDAVDVYGNASSIHQLGRNSRILIEQARKSIAGHLNASIGELFFTSCGTESNNTVLKRSIKDMGVTHIISSALEHHCVLHTVEFLYEQDEVSVSYVKVLSDGHLDLEHLEQLLGGLKGEKVLVSLMHANNEIGNLLDLERVGAICKSHNALFHTDTVQTMGHFKFDLQALNIHFLSGSAHKFHGPKGIGFMYISDEVRLYPYIHGGSQERNMRGGTENLIGIKGLQVALDDAYAEFEERKSHTLALKQYFMCQLKESFGDKVGFNGDAEHGLYTILSVAFPSDDLNDLIVFNLDIQGVCVSGGSACSSGVESGSHVLAAIDNTDLRKTVRFSFSHLNTFEELDYTIQQLEKILNR